MIWFPKSNKGWQKLCIRVIDLIGFKVNLRWRVARVGGNWASGVMPEEQEDYNKL